MRDSSLSAAEVATAEAMTMTAEAAESEVDDDEDSDDDETRPIKKSKKSKKAEVAISSEAMEVATTISPIVSEILSRGIGTDAIICVGEQEYKVHKAIMAVSSEYFNGLYSSGYGMKDSERHQLHDMHSDTFDLIIQWIYDGKFWIQTDKLMPILIAADMLQIDSLRTTIMEHIKPTVNSQTCTSVLDAADRTNLRDLYSYTIVQCLLYWKELRYSDFTFEQFNDLLNSIGRQYTEYNKVTAIDQWISQRWIKGQPRVSSQLSDEQLSQLITQICFSDLTREEYDKTKCLYWMANEVAMQAFMISFDRWNTFPSSHEIQQQNSTFIWTIRKFSSLTYLRHQKLPRIDGKVWVHDKLNSAIRLISKVERDCMSKKQQDILKIVDTYPDGVNNTKIVSPMFMTHDGTADDNWQLSLMTENMNVGDNNHISIYLQYNQDKTFNGPRKTVRRQGFAICLENQRSPMKSIRWQFLNIFNKTQMDHGLHTFHQIDTLDAEGFLVNDTLKISCTFNMVDVLMQPGE